ncbi:MAG: thiamine pyrophosphate-binding protein [Rhodospirillales bacterium]|jgi:sulfopyruvate decarboxylase alpha subunit
MSWQENIFESLLALDVRQVAYVPDAGHIELIRRANEDERMTAIPLSTEEEGVAVLAGAWLGGERGVLLMQSSGVGNCINMFSLVKTCQFPLLVLVTMRGQQGESNPWQNPMGSITGEVLSLAGLDVQKISEPENAGEIVARLGAQVFAEEKSAAILIEQKVVGLKKFGD